MGNAGQLINRMQNREFRHRCYVAGMIAARIATILLTLVICIATEPGEDDGSR